MPAVIPGFEYDIFISYRHNDNLDGWVTDFVQNLEKELRGTIKDPVSMYFDVNPHDGLLETHNVDKSLEGKLKCLIFIPIISQTYCDTKSFAWQHEFCAFNRMVREDQFGRDIKLSNGNVASRILPVKIHDLDAEDKLLLEKELGGVLRAVEFIFNSTGVSRPLTATDKREENANKIFYRDQINKVARAIKELMVGMQRPKDWPKETSNQKPALPKPRRRKITWVAGILILLTALSLGYYFIGGTGSKTNPTIDRSIAVLPFTNMSKDDSQDFFSDGLTEDIITQLAKIKSFQVISRTSVMFYKKNPKPIKEIAKELGVASILEGSVQRSGDQLRITAQLINAATDEHLWAESYDRPLKDLFAIQSDVAKQIAIALKTKITAFEMTNIERAQTTTNMEAYAFYQKALVDSYSNSKDATRREIQNLLRAIELDKNYAVAYAQLSEAYHAAAYYQYDLYDLEKVWQLAKESAMKAIELDPSCAQGYYDLAYISRTHDWNWNEAEQHYKRASLLNPIYLNHYSLLLGALGRFDECLAMSNKSLHLDPLNSQIVIDVSRMHYYAGNMAESIKLAQSVLVLDPEYRKALGQIGCGLEQQGLLDASVAMISKSATRTGTDYEGAGDRFETTPAPYKTYWKDVLKRTLEDAKKKRIPSVIMAILYMRNGNTDEALSSLEKAFKEREGGIVYVNVEPLFKPLHDDPRFKKIVHSMGLVK